MSLGREVKSGVLLGFHFVPFLLSTGVIFLNGEREKTVIKLREKIEEKEI